MESDDHAFVQRIAGIHEHASALLQFPQRIGDRFAGFSRNQHPTATLGDLGLHRTVVVEHVAHDASASRHGHEFGLKADQPARGNAVIEPHAPLAVGLHVLKIAAARAQRFHHRALVRLLGIDRQHFERLAPDAVDLPDHDARARYSEFVSFAAHVLDQDGEVQLSAPGDEEYVCVRRVLDAQRDVAHSFARQALAQLATGDELPLAAGERRRVHLEIHGERRLVHLQ